MSNTDLPIVATNDVTAASAVVTDDFIKSRILTIRGTQIMLDRDLAELYGVETRVLNQAVKRNSKRFPSNFMFQLSTEEAEALRSSLLSFDASYPRSQFVTLKRGIFHDRFLILDGTELYHFGASLKDMGRQYCAVTKMDALFIPSIMQRI